MPTVPRLIPPGTLRGGRGAPCTCDACARARLLALTDDLDGQRLLGPRLAIVNPPLWEIGHVAWFQEHWCLRMRADGTLARQPGSTTPTRCTTRPRSRTIRAGTCHCRRSRATLRYLEAVLDRVREALARRPDDERLRYFAELAACHEDMHGEALPLHPPDARLPGAAARAQRPPPALGADAGATSRSTGGTFRARRSAR